MPPLAGFLCSILLSLFGQSLGFDNDTIFPTQRYTRASAAVWGEPTPDYSLLTLKQEPHRLLRTLVFLDNKITKYYGFDLDEVRNKVLELLQEANTYFVQFRLGLTAVDILQTDRGDLSLYSFQEYRNQRLHKLPVHDFAVLLSFKYAGGLAFVSGMCSPQSVMLCGFYPQNPSAMGSIFFHEVAHLMGVPHKDPNATLKVQHCTCKPVKDNVDEPCLRIPGFDHDCTAQQLANIIYKNRCLKVGTEAEQAVGICGNGVVEDGEQCDCGLAAQCGTLSNCNFHNCEYKVHPAWLYMFAFLISALCLLILLFYAYRRGLFEWVRKSTTNERPLYKSNLAHSGSFKHYTSSPFHAKKSFPASQVSPGSVVVLLDGHPTSAMTPGSTGTIQRPKLPPPPPPPKIVAKSTISVQMPSHVYEVPTSRMGISGQEPSADSLSWKFDDFDSGDEGSLPGSYEGRPGVPTLPAYPARVPINRVTVQFRGSDHTMSTECPSSSASDSSLIKAT